MSQYINKVWRCRLTCGIYFSLCRLSSPLYEHIFFCEESEDSEHLTIETNKLEYNKRLEWAQLTVVLRGIGRRNLHLQISPAFSQAKSYHQIRQSVAQSLEAALHWACTFNYGKSLCLLFFFKKHASSTFFC